MTRTVSVTRHRRGYGKESGDESRAFGAAMAHASTAIPGSGDRALRAAVDASPRTQGLLGHGGDAEGVPPFSRHL